MKYMQNLSKMQLRAWSSLCLSLSKLRKQQSQLKMTIVYLNNVLHFVEKIRKHIQDL